MINLRYAKVKQYPSLAMLRKFFAQKKSTAGSKLGITIN